MEENRLEFNLSLHAFVRFHRSFAYSEVSIHQGGVIGGWKEQSIVTVVAL